MGNELDQTRLAALHQAAHDLKGNASAKEVVERAEVYLAFLSAPDTEKALIRCMGGRYCNHSAGTCTATQGGVAK